MSEDAGTNNDGGQQNVTFQPWMDSLPDAHKQNESFTQFKEPSEAWDKFDSFLKAEGNTVVIPGDEASDEDRATFLNKMGRPETADKYTFTKPEGLPEGMAYDENVSEAFKGVFHDIGLSDAQASKLWGKYHEIAANGFETTQKSEKEALDASVNSLKDEWTGDKYNVNTEIATRTFTKVFEDEKTQSEAKSFIEDTKVGGVALGDHPMFLKIFHQMGSIIGDDSLNHNRGGEHNGGQSEEDLAKKRFPKTYPQK